MKSVKILFPTAAHFITYSLDPNGIECMNPAIEILNDKLSELESITDFDGHHIASVIQEARSLESKEDPCSEWKYELLAFAFGENYDSKNGGWGTYFGPMVIWRANDGQKIESPSFSDISKEALEYWGIRSKTTKNPLLKARYAELVWDLMQRVTGNSPHVDFAIDSVEAILCIAEKSLYKHEVSFIQKLKRALSIARSIKTPDLIERVKNAILTFEDAIAEDSKPGLWGFSFDLLIGSKKVALSEAEENKIISDLENRLHRLKNGDPWSCEHAAGRLAEYYKKRNLAKEAERVILALGNTFETTAVDAAPLISSSLLGHIHRIYINFNLKDEAERVATAIRAIGPRLRDDMEVFSYEMSISKKELDEYVEQFIQDSMEESLALIAIEYLPKQDEIKQQLSKLGQEYPLSFLFTKQIVDHQGRVVAQVGSLDDDMDGNVIHQMAGNMNISAHFLSVILDRAIERYEITSEKLVDYLFLSPIYVDQQREFIFTGISSYLQKQFVVAIHLMIPQIEAAVRYIIESSGGAVLKQGRGGAFQLKTLDELLRSPELSVIIGEDTALYMRVLLTDQRGWNIRNDVCHGLSPFDQMSKAVADRLVHILLRLALLRAREP